MKDFILITGGAGFIGSHLLEGILDKYPHKKVIVLDDLSTGKLENIIEDERVVFIEGSITNRNLLRELFNLYKFEKVFHLAAVASVQRSVEEPEYTHSVNFDGTMYLLEESKRNGVEKFIFASSAAVYGDLPELPKREDMPVKPLTPYAVDKYASERYVVNSFSLYGLPTTALRFFNVFGERQDPSSPYSGVLSIFVDRIRRFQNGEKTEIVIYGDGKQTRDFIYVKDVIQALLLTSETEKSNGEVYNVGLGKSVSLLEILEILKDLVGELPPIVFAEERKGDIKYSQSDNSKLKSIGFKPRFSLKDGLRRLLKYEGVLLKEDREVSSYSDITQDLNDAI
jgi:UDP-glucose 4-epimerase